MKKILYISIIVLNVSHIKAQVTTIRDQFSSNLTKKELNFSSDRKLFAIGLNDKLTENYIVVSKNKRGAEGDVLYIDKFTKKNKKKYIKTFTAKFTHPINLSISFDPNRMMYKDIDKDGNAEFIYIIKEQEKGMESPLKKVTGLVVYKNKDYRMWSDTTDNFTTTHFDEKFKELPSEVSSEFIDFWNNLKKV